MPNRCSAPGCRSNYAGEPYTPVFKLPNGPPDLVNRWHRALCREGIRDLKNVFVCSKHFLDEEIQTSFSIHQPDGTYLEVPAKPKLQKDAVPRFLPGCPLHLSSSSDTIPPRFDRSLREQHLIDTAINESLLQYNQDKELFQITTLEDLVSKTKHSGLPSLINDIRQLNDLLKEIENHSAPTNSPETFQHHVREATGRIHKAIDSLSTGEESGNQQPLLSSLQFILCQLDNALIAKTMRYLQSLDCLSLPHLSTLKRLYSNFGLDSEFTNNLKQSVTQFNKWERNEVIQMDEIHVKSTFTYKGGKIIRSSLNPTDPAKTVFAFMISSLSKRWSSIVRLLPCSSSSAEVLFPIIKDVIRDVEACGLSVHVLCTDNYPMNVNIFKLFSPSRLLEHIVPHPMDSNRPLFLLFDFVHIIKSIRNNWLNQIDYNKTFTYPDFENIQVASTAVFEEIRKLYKSDQHSVAKLAPRLTSKACWPSTLERQNVSLALRIFDESTAAALNVSYQSRYHTSTNSQTADFITIICNVWKIFNINTPNKGILHKDEFSVPLTYNDTRFMFLQRVVDWAECWRVMPDKRTGYSVHAYYKHSTKCQSCLLFLTENKEMEIEEPSDSEYRLIQIIDRGSLKWPSSDVIDAIITLWKVFSSIESQPSIFNNFITGPSRSILIQLTTSLIEDEQAEVWRVMCDECGTLM
ncbi:Transposable element P transposase [Oopsacas minuta]|uniref:Transposable element P transposase n=2 Tax=Oopsacas minuta TaxID=111878 RepID=A0AAV7JR09_9METZ|nr:Transposable element P transposase [Oopsacas minuta]